VVVLSALYWITVLFLGVTAALWLNIPLLLVCAGLIAVRFPKQGSEKCPTVFRQKPAPKQKTKQTKRGRSRASLLRRRRLCWLAFALAGLAVPFVLNSAHHRMAAWDRQILERGADSLTMLDRSAIYLGNIWMAIGGFCVGAPEAAVETLAMMVPDEDGAREANWVFFAHDSSVLAAAETLARDLMATSRAHGKRAIQWPPGVYSLANYRVSLATAGGSVVLRRGQAPGEFAASVDVPIRYTQGAELGLLRSGLLDLTIPESLFWALEQAGWLHPYVMRYHFKLRIAGDGAAIEDAD
jgi:hypothetical protein